MCPLVKELGTRPGIESLCCVTAQHRQMLDAVLEVFRLKPDWDLDIMTPRQTLSGITSKCLLGMDEAIATPRLKTPRVKIPAGSVGIAGSQTGVYPIDSPGGWQLIGRTPVRMYDAGRATPILPQAGQYIKFYAIDQAEFDKIAAQEAAEGYQVKRHPRKEGGK